MTIKERFRQLHPAIRTVIWMIPITFTVFLHDLFTNQAPELRELLRSYYRHSIYDPKEVFYLIVKAPFFEEITYRGPAYLVLLIVVFLSRKFPGKKFLKIIGYFVFFIVLLIPTLVWARGHHYPITVFGYGILWGLLMLQTRSIIYPIIFHSGSNAIAVLGIWLGIHTIYS